MEVRLSDIDRDLRLRIASTLADKEGLTGLEYLDLMWRAADPQDDPVIEVDVAKAEYVLELRRQPPGTGVWRFE